MSKIENLDDIRKSKKARKRLNQEKEVLELEILILQKRLEVIESFLEDDIKDIDWHEKPPMASEEIKNLYAEFMKSDYWKKDD
jgi:hypothetical protein